LIYQALGEGIRLDGRGLNDYRDVRDSCPSRNELIIFRSQLNYQEMNAEVNH
jgi:hypothetical protein